MSERDALLHRLPEAAVRALALDLLDEAAAAAAHLRAGTDEEALHDFRVALRRLRTLFKAYRELLRDSVSKKQARRLRDLAGDTGGARDAEVQLEWLTAQEEHLKPGARRAWSWMMERLEARRQGAYSAVRVDVLQRFTELEASLRRDLSRYVATLVRDGARPNFAAAAAEMVRGTGAALVAALDQVRAPTDVEEAHHARIQGKRLRYLLEPLQRTSLEQPVRRLIRSIKDVQEVLGKLHDMHVLAAEIASSLVETSTERALVLHEALYAPSPALPEKDLRPGILAIDRLVRDRVEALYQELRAGWNEGVLATFSTEVEALAAALARPGWGAEDRFVSA